MQHVLHHGLSTTQAGVCHTRGSVLTEFGPGPSWLGLFSFPGVPRANSNHPAHGIPAWVQSQGMALPQLHPQGAGCCSPPIRSTSKPLITPGSTPAWLARHPGLVRSSVITWGDRDSSDGHVGSEGTGCHSTSHRLRQPLSSSRRAAGHGSHGAAARSVSGQH